VTELHFVQLVTGDNKAAFLLNLALPCFEYGGNACVNAIANNLGLTVLAWASFAFESEHFDDARIV